MTLTVTTNVNGEVAEITLSGSLDAASAPDFQSHLEALANQHLRHLVLHMGKLEYMASAGVRMLIFARQKMGPTVDVFIIAPQQQVLDTLRRTGVHTSIIIQDEYVLEN